MASFFRKTFGGLPRGYYSDHIVAGAALGLLHLIWSLYTLITLPKSDPQYEVWKWSPLFDVLGAVLYPYSFWMVQRILRSLRGETPIFQNPILVPFAKLSVALFSLAWASVFAPVALIYLYFENSKS